MKRKVSLVLIFPSLTVRKPYSLSIEGLSYFPLQLVAPLLSRQERAETLKQCGTMTPTSRSASASTMVVVKEMKTGLTPRTNARQLARE